MCDRPDLSDPRPLILLLVADEPLREALRFSLETEGYAASAPAAPDACMACVDCSAAACVVIDDSDRSWPHRVGGRPTIVLTGDAERLVRAGVRGVSVVEKPLLDDALGRRLAEVLGAQA